ncbi:MAG TPA: hypothetical protein VIG45_06195 [Erysipelothrix sp.]
MSKKVFISGSISVKKLPISVMASLQKMIDNQLEILVGDASGIDELVQHFFAQQQYYNVTVYSITHKPRIKRSSNFKSQYIEVVTESSRERERQRDKDAAMTNDSDYSLVIWDGFSKGSYANILRSIQQGKSARVYLSGIQEFLPQEKVSENEIKYIYETNNGYSAREVVKYLQEKDINFFKNTLALNKYLVNNNVIEKKDKDYIPLADPKYFIINYYHGKMTGFSFTMEFVGWLEAQIKDSLYCDEQKELF